MDAPDPRPTLASWAATLAFARLLLACLVLVNAAGWVFLQDPMGHRGALMGLLAILSAWLAQGLYTADREAAGRACKTACIIFAGWSGLCFVLLAS